MTSGKETAQLVWEEGPRKIMQEAIAYLESIHDKINPDFFKIPEDKLARAKIFAGAAFADVGVNDILFMQMLVDAAQEYNARKTTGDAACPDAEHLGDLAAFLFSAESALFRQKNLGGA